METKYCEELLLPNLIFLNNKETQRHESSVDKKSINSREAKLSINITVFQLVDEVAR